MKKTVTFEFDVTNDEDLNELEHFNKANDYFFILTDIHNFLKNEQTTLEELKRSFYKRVETYNVELD